MQRLISDIRHRALLKVDKLTREGWRIVPGTIVIHTVAYVPGIIDTVPRDAHEHGLETHLSIVLEKDDA